MVVIQGTIVIPSIIHTLPERLRSYEIASFVCMAVKITQEVTVMPNIHFHHSWYLVGGYLNFSHFRLRLKCNKDRLYGLVNNLVLRLFR